MIQRKRLAAALLSLTMAFAAVYPAVPSFAAAWERNANGSYVAADGSALTGITARGIDVSHWKQSINWNAVAADTFLIITPRTAWSAMMLGAEPPWMVPTFSVAWAMGERFLDAIP